MATRRMIHWYRRAATVHSVGNTISLFFFQRKIQSCSDKRSRPLRRIITHAAPCATTVEAETTELIEDIVYRYFSTLGTRGMHQWYAIIRRRRRVCRDDAKVRDATRRGHLASHPLLYSTRKWSPSSVHWCIKLDSQCIRAAIGKKDGLIPHRCNIV